MVSAGDVLMIFLLFWLWIMVLNRVFKLYERGVSVAPGFLMIRTQRVNQFIDRCAEKLRGTWKKIWDLAIILGFLFMFLAFFVFFSNLFAFIYTPKQAAPVAPIIPGITISLASLPYFFIAVAVVIIVHELSHGVAARTEDVEVKSAGFLLFLFIPGGFVEPEEESLNKAPLRSRARIYAAGTMPNITMSFALIVVLLNFGLLIAPMWGGPQGVMLTGVRDESPAEIGGLENGDIIEKVTIYNNYSQYVSELDGNSSKVKDMTDLFDALEDTKPNNTVVFAIKERGDIPVNVSEPPEELEESFEARDLEGYIGISYTTYYPPKDFTKTIFGNQSKWLPFHLTQLVVWVWLLSFIIALVNLLPIPPFDGYKLLGVTLEWKFGATPKTQTITRIIGIIAALLLILNLTLSYIISGWTILF